MTTNSERNAASRAAQAQAEQSKAEQLAQENAQLKAELEELKKGHTDPATGVSVSTTAVEAPPKKKKWGSK